MVPRRLIWPPNVAIHQVLQSSESGSVPQVEASDEELILPHPGAATLQGSGVAVRVQTDGAVHTPILANGRSDNESGDGEFLSRLTCRPGRAGCFMRSVLHAGSWKDAKRSPCTSLVGSARWHNFLCSTWSRARCASGVLHEVECATTMNCATPIWETGGATMQCERQGGS